MMFSSFCEVTLAFQRNVHQAMVMNTASSRPSSGSYEGEANKPVSPRMLMPRVYVRTEQVSRETCITIVGVVCLVLKNSHLFRRRA